MNIPLDILEFVTLNHLEFLPCVISVRYIRFGFFFYVSYISTVFIIFFDEQFHPRMVFFLLLIIHVNLK